MLVCYPDKTIVANASILFGFYFFLGFLFPFLFFSHHLSVSKNIHEAFSTQAIFYLKIWNLCNQSVLICLKLFCLFTYVSEPLSLGHRQSIFFWPFPVVSFGSLPWPNHAGFHLVYTRWSSIMDGTKTKNLIHYTYESFCSSC